MFRTISFVFTLSVVIVVMSACTCPYCEKLEYKDTQTTIEAEVQKKAQELVKISDRQEGDITSVLTSLLSGNARIFGAAYASAPYDESNELIETYYVFRDGDDIKKIHDPAYSFMTSENSNWYKKPYLSKKAEWSIPYYDVDGSGANYYLTTYSYPILENGEVQFILTADYLLSTK